MALTNNKTLMTPPDILKVADLLALVYVPEMVNPPTAAKVAEVCTELARLQTELRQLAHQIADNYGLIP